MGEEQREHAGAFVDLAALDADATVLDHVDAAEPVGADDRVELRQQLVERCRHSVEAHRDTALEADDELASASLGASATARVRS